MTESSSVSLADAALQNGGASSEVARGSRWRGQFRSSGGAPGTDQVEGPVQKLLVDLQWALLQVPVQTQAGSCTGTQSVGGIGGGIQSKIVLFGPTREGEN